jgi:hypothetical protein
MNLRNMSVSLAPSNGGLKMLGTNSYVDLLQPRNQIGGSPLAIAPASNFSTKSERLDISPELSI